MVAIAALAISFGQMKISKDALAVATSANSLNRDIFESSERPWIQLQITIGGELLFKNNTVSFPLILNLKNVGRSPATPVVISYQGILYDSKIDPFHLQKLLCGYIGLDPFNTKSYANSRTNTLFPANAEEGFIEVKIKKEIITAKMNEPYVVPLVIGCIIYGSPFKAGYYQTGFILPIRRKEALGIPVKDQVIQANELEVMPPPYSAIFAE